MTSINSLKRLNGRSVFLSASVPDPARDDRFSRIADAPFQVEQAVVSLARAVFSEGGRLVFGGHPTISPLVATVAAEYREPNLTEGGKERAEPQVVIFQSEVFREFIPSDTDLLIRLGLAEERWTEAIGDERFISGEGSPLEQCPRSLYEMRRQMLVETDPAAMVCVGGMEGVRREAGMFREQFRDRPIFTLARTGGAASLLHDLPERTFAIDLEITSYLPLPEDEEPVREGEIDVQPYPLIMQMIVDRIVPPAERDGRYE
jgi:hypothetical protein